MFNCHHSCFVGSSCLRYRSLISAGNEGWIVQKSAKQSVLANSIVQCATFSKYPFRFSIGYLVAIFTICLSNCVRNFASFHLRLFWACHYIIPRLFPIPSLYQRPHIRPNIVPEQQTNGTPYDICSKYSYFDSKHDSPMHRTTL